MPIGSTNVYYPGDLILSTVSSSGTSFIETKIVASTSSLIYFDNNARINSASLSSFTFGSSSYSLTSSYSVYAETASNAQNAQDILVYVKNTSGAIITKGSLVRIKDVENSGFNPTIELASFTNESGSANTLGYAYQQFAINDLGYVITEGKLTGVNTGNFSPGDLLYLSSSGQYTNVKPIPPNHGVRVGQVIRAHPTVGSIYVTIDNGAELDELHNVIDNSTTSSYGDLLTKSGSIWINSKNLTGSYTLSGSLTTNGAISALNVTASLLGTASWANNSISSSYSLTSSYINLSSSNVFVQGGNSFGTTAILGTNDAQPLSLETNGTTRMSINSNGLIGINTSPNPAARVNILDTHVGSLGSSSLYIQTNQNQVDGNSSNDAGITNIYYVNAYTSSTAVQNQAAFNQLYINGSGSFSGSYRASRNAINLSNTASFHSLGAIINTYCTNQISPNIPSFNIPNWVAGTQTYVDLTTGNTTGSITNLYNHYIGSPFLSAGAGGITVNNSYGVYIDKQKTTNIVNFGWGVYQADTGDLNIFAGKTRIGSTTIPVNSLDVTGNISASAVTASLFFGTSSWANNSTSASYALTASYVNISSSNVFLQGGNSFGTTALLGTNDAQPLIFETSGSERMRILSGGNIGIGTSAASELLDVYRLNTGGWNPRIVARDGTNAAFIGVYSGQPGVFAHNNALNAWADLYLNTSDPTNSVGSGNVFIGGNVGIGTTTPTALLDVSYGDYQNAGTLRLGADIGVNRSRTNNSRKYGSITGFPYNNFSASVQAIGIDAINSTTTGLTIGGGSVSFASPTQIQFYTTSSTTAPGAERMRIDSNGNVGIGTTSPVQKLDVSGSIYINNNASYLYGKTTGGSATRMIGINVVNDFYIGSVDQAVSSIRINNNGSDRVIIDSSGNVGIGTTSPTVLLDVSGSSRFGFTSINTHQFTGSVNINGQLTSSNARINGTLTSTRLAEKIVTFTPQSGSFTGAPAWYRIISGSGVADYGRVRMSANFDNSRSDLEFVYGVRNYDTDGAGAFINITRASTYNSIFNAVRVIETGNLAEPYAIDVLIGNYLNIQAPGTITCLYESQFIGAVLDTPFFVSASATGSNVVKTVDNTYTSGYPRIGPTYSDGLAVATSQGQLTVGYRGNYAYNNPNYLNYALLVSGSVGINTASPSQKLHVVGDALIASTSTAGNLYFGGTDLYVRRDNNYDLSLVQNGDSNSALYLASAGNVYLNIDSNNNDTTKAFIVQNDALKSGTELFRVQENGSVGIGTSSPNNKLDVVGGTGTTIGLSNSDDANRGGKLSIISGSATGRQFYVGTTSAIYNLVFGIDSVEKARIDTSGNVGIGTTVPSAKLSVSGSIESLTDNGGEGGQLVLRGNTYRYNVDNFNGQALRIFREDDLTTANGAVLMYVSASGNVGIGTSVPTQKLEVQGNVQFGNDSVTSVGLRLNRLNGGFRTSEHTFHSTQNSPWYTYGQNLTWTNELAGTVESTQAYRPYFEGFAPAVGYKVFGFMNVTTGSFTSANVINALVIKNDGNVGIGTTSPAFLLDVSGSSRHGFTSSNTHLFTGSVSVSNNVTCLSLTETSTEAVKYNIVPLPSQLENVLKLTPVSFNYKTNNKHSIGLIAEEVAKVYPEFTSENNDSISYGKITSVLIQSIKELKSIIDTQQKQIEELSNKFKQL